VFVAFAVSADKADPTDAALTGGDPTANNTLSVLAPANAIPRVALDAALPADLRTRFASDEPVAAVVSLPRPDRVDEHRSAFAAIPPKRTWPWKRLRSRCRVLRPDHGCRRDGRCKRAGPIGLR